MKEDDFMKYYINKTSFSNEKVEITNQKIIEQIKEAKLEQDNSIIVSDCGVTIKLKAKTVANDFIIFEI